MKSRAELIQRHDELRTERRREEPAWEEQALFLRPDDTSFDQYIRDREDGDIYDSTPLYANDTFASGLFGQMTNPANRWFELALDDEDRAKFRPNAEWLYRVTNIGYSSLSPQISSFYAEAPSVFANIGCFGNGYLSQEEIVGWAYISDRSVPVGQMYVDIDYKGDVSEVHRAFPLTGRQLKQKFSGRFDEGKVRDEARYRIIHAVCANEEYRPGRGGLERFPWISYYFSEDVRDMWRVGGFEELPYHRFGWNRRDGRAYDTGPGHNARPDLGTLNEMERSNVVSAAFAAEPPLLTVDDTYITAADVVPNAVIEGGMNSQGKQIAAYLERRSQLQPNTQQSEQRRNAIRTAFYYSLMMLIQRPQMTATEFLGFQEEILKLMADKLVRVQGGLASFLIRRFKILQRAGQLPPPPPELRGRIQIRFVSPLARLQKLAQARGAMNWVAQLGQAAQLIGDPTLMDNVDGDELAAMLREANTELVSIQRDPKQRDALRQARAQQMMMPQQLDNVSKVVDIGATVSHALQAKTLADKRGQQRGVAP